MSCMLGVSPRPLTISPFSVSAVCLVMLFLACSSATSFAIAPPFAILPGAAPDAVTCVDGAGALCAQVGVPRLAARARRLRAFLTDLVRAGEATEVGALAGAGAGDEEAHIGR